MLCNIRMTLQVTHALIILAAAVSVRGNSAVKEIRTPYSCCDRTIKFNPKCQHTWIIQNKPFAVSNGASNQCSPPCLKIEDGLMTLDQCVDVNATVVCTNGMNVENVKEERRCLYGQPCPGSASNAGNQGSVGVLLLAVVIAGLTVSS